MNLGILEPIARISASPVMEFGTVTKRARLPAMVGADGLVFRVGFEPADAHGSPEGPRHPRYRGEDRPDA